MEPVEILLVLKLVVEPTDNPELYDFLFGSGVVLWEDGVDVFRGIMDGERELGLGSEVAGWIFATCDKLCGWCMDIRFSRCASVGEIVLAPKPET